MRVPVSTVDEVSSLPADVSGLISTLHEQAPTPSLTLGLGVLQPSSVRSRAATDFDLDSFTSNLLAKPEPTSSVVVEEAPKLEHWTVQAHIYSEDIAAKIGILGALFGGTGRVARVGAVHEAKRFRVETTGEGRDVEIGVAVRLAVAVTEWDTKIEVSLPNIAASAQLHGYGGRIGIEVLGYSGPLGALLPAPRALDVTTCADYLNAFSEIQEQVFGDSGLPFIAPAALSYEGEPTPTNGHNA